MTDNTIFLLSYPKSGRTWLRMIIGKYISKKYNLEEEDSLTYGKELEKLGLKNLFHTHASYTWEKEDITLKDLYNKPIILLSRNVNDTIVSYYHHIKYRLGQKRAYKGNISDFIKSNKGVKQIKEFYKNIENMNFIYKTSYEELHANGFEVCKNILEILGEKVDDNILKESIEFCEFSNMQKYEKESKLAISTAVKINVNDKKTFKVREGKVNNYKKYLSNEDIEYIEKVIKS